MIQMPEQDFPPGRHQLLKEHLMSEIRPTGEAVAKPRKRWVRPAFAAAAVVTVAAVTFTVLPSSDGADAKPRTTSAAKGQDGYGKIRNDQYVYVATEKSFYKADGKGKRVFLPPFLDEVWIAADGKGKTLVRSGMDDYGDGSGFFTGPETPGQELYGNYISYSYLKSLPTDADGMYKHLMKYIPRLLDLAGIDSPVFTGEEYDQHQARLLQAGILLKGSLVPTAQGAALYQAVARIPGVTLTKDSVDARGRHGLGIARTDTKLPVRIEWTLDKKTYALLGKRSILTQDYKGLKKGTVISSATVQSRVVVDKPGERS
ncbi:CU044_5270 family protein [Streptomyces sp. NPDC001858]